MCLSNRKSDVRFPSWALLGEMGYSWQSILKNRGLASHSPTALVRSHQGAQLEHGSCDPSQWAVEPPEPPLAVKRAPESPPGQTEQRRQQWEQSHCPARGSEGAALPSMETPLHAPAGQGARLPRAGLSEIRCCSCLSRQVRPWQGQVQNRPHCLASAHHLRRTVCGRTWGEQNVKTTSEEK